MWQRGHSPLFHRAELVGLDGLDADVKLCGDLLVAEPLGDTEHDLGFPIGEGDAIGLGRPGSFVHDVADELAGQP